MRIKNLNNSAFTLLEILLAAIIFVVTIGGLFISLNSVRGPVIQRENALTAAIFGKQVLDTLRSSVNGNTYYNGCSQPLAGNACGDFSLWVGTHEVAALPAPLAWPAGFIGQNPNGLVYTVSCADGSAGPNCSDDSARQVNLSINWPNT